ncbi:MAG: hypothetical protein CBD58_00135 [bacterium TMED198]|nr:MAG: hypothetical protein CBD58_00135 [bacterium TMED198]
MKKVLVTGSNGQLGTYVVDQLNSDFLVIPSEKMGINSIKLDITSRKNVSEVLKKYDPDVVINCAALTNVDACERFKDKAQQINVVGLKNIVNLSTKKTKIIQVSTDYVFDGKEKMYFEDSIPNPINVYGRTKLEAENFLRGSNKDFLILRTSSVFSHDFNSFFHWVYNNLLMKNKIKVASDMFSTPTWSRSLAVAIQKSIIMNLSGLYHYAGLNPISRLHFSKLICRYFNLDESLLIASKSIDMNFVAKRPVLSNISSKKIEKEICFASLNTEHCLRQISNLIS